MAGRTVTAGLEVRARVARSGFVLDVAFDVAAGTVVAVVGPNGAGKSTLLRVLAGLAVEGEVAVSSRLGDRELTGPTERRPVGVAFQDLRLFPHLDAVDNVAFPLRARGMPRRPAREAAARELGAVGLDDTTRGRRPAALSGGEAQRVALARALVGGPQLLLLDEPFAAVDAEYRTGARAALAGRLGAFDGVTLLVTHDPADALLLGDRVLVLEAGRVTQFGTAGEVARHPASTYAATLVGTNLLRAVRDAGAVRTAAGTEVVVADPGADGPVGVIIPPHAVALHPTEPGGTPRNVWPVSVDAVEVLGGRARVQLALPRGDELVAEVTLASVAELGISVGQALWASVKATEIAVVTGIRP